MKTARVVTIMILLFVCATASYGSYHMIKDPTGNSLKLPDYLLNGTAFSNYSLIGWILLFVAAIFSFMIILMVLTKCKYGSFCTILQGVFLCIFVFVQFLLLPETFSIQYVFLALAIGLIFLGAMQNQSEIIDDSKKIA